MRSPFHTIVEIDSHGCRKPRAWAEPSAARIVSGVLLGIECVDSYYCIVNLPGVPVRDISVLDARDDHGANAALSVLARHWVGYETLYLYCGERLVTVLANPALGFADPLPDLDLADIRFATAA